MNGGNRGNARVSPRPIGIAWPRRLAFLSILFLLAAGTQVRAEDGTEVVGSKSKIKLSGVGWVTWRYQIQNEAAREPAPATASGESSAQDESSFDIERVYITADYAVNDRYSWQTQLEAANVGGDLALFLKKAYFRAQAPFGIGGTTARIGQFSHVMTGLVEKTWDYRIVSKVPLDRYMGVSTTWVGVGGDGTLLDDRLALDLAVTNELSYNKPGKDIGGGTIPHRSRYETYMGRATIRPLPDDPALGGLSLSAFGQTSGKEAPESAPQTGWENNRNTWYGFLAAFAGKTGVLGFEFDQKLDRAPRMPAGAAEWRVSTVTSQVVSGFGWFEPIPDLRVFGRIDNYDPDTDVDDNAYTVIMGGVSHAYTPTVRTILDLSYVSFQEPPGTSLDPDVALAARLQVSL